MITILHGQNLVASRKELQRIKDDFRGEIISLDGKNLTETDFIQATSSNSMFSTNRLVVIEGLPKVDLIDVTSNLVIWEDKKVVCPKGIKNLEFKIPQTIWNFLDNMTVPNFRAALKDNDIQFIFIMMARQYKGDKSRLLELDYQNKQGLLPCDFATAIELFLLGI